MRSIETQQTFPLSSVKPLDGLVSYREHCLNATRQALRRASRHRNVSPVDGTPLERLGALPDVPYARSPSTGSLFLAELPDPSGWADVLAEVAAYRHSPQAFHEGLTQSRADHVYAPKLEWIRDTLRLQGIERPRIFDVATDPSPFTNFLRQSELFAAVITIDEMALAHGAALRRRTESQIPEGVEAAVLLESLDRVDEPVALMTNVVQRLVPGGLVFVTALVASGFDIATLGLRNLYVYPPDRTNCFSLRDLTSLLTQSGLTLLEVSTPGVLDVDIVRAHVARDPSIRLSGFERRILEADAQTQAAFQRFLQQQQLSSFTRIVGRKP